MGCLVSCQCAHVRWEEIEGGRDGGRGGCGVGEWVSECGSLGGLGWGRKGGEGARRSLWGKGGGVGVAGGLSSLTAPQVKGRDGWGIF